MSQDQNPFTPREEPGFSLADLLSFGAGAASFEPTAEMRQAAQQARNVFLSYTGAGFNDQQALTLLCHLITPLRAS